jgi:eukaryotic-like serine/threonine-protein kinase
MNDANANRTAAATPEQLKRSAELSKLEPEFPAVVGDRYELQGLIAKGGMGSVHKAWDRTFQRVVAIKLIHGSAENLQALARFKHESLISGQLQHPNIPPVYDLGTYEESKPFLAMKLVKGRTLADHIKHPGPDTPNLVAVYEAVCHAVGYAHSRHVVHRDLKPLNVMVGAFGEVQVMDWGLAKVLTDGDATAPTDYDPDATSNLGTKIGDPDSTDDSKTTAGTILGTPSYMPPEQAIGAIDQISPSSDVFGLGAILCAILTGKSVYVGESSESTRQMAARAETAEAFARLDASGAEPELIALAKRCLAAKPADRFAHGTEVANEVMRIRAAADERAKQAEIGRARSEARRRVLAWSAASVFLVLAAGVAGTGVGLYRADKARQKAITAEGATAAQLIATQAAEAQAKAEATAKGIALEAEQRAKAEAEANLKQAKENLGFALKGNEILGSVFSGLDPKASYRSVAEFRDALKKNLRTAVKELEGTSIGDPLTVAAMQNTLGQSLLGMGETELAITVMEKARATRKAKLGTVHHDTLTSMNNLAEGYRAAGQLDRALPLLEETLKLMSTTLGPNHRDTLGCMSNLALGYFSAGRLDRALQLTEETLKIKKASLGSDHPSTLISMNNLAEGYRAIGKLDRALPLFEETRKLMTVKLGPNHPDTLTCMNNLSLGYQAAGQFDLALPLLEETLKRRTTKLGSDHPDTLMSMNNLAMGYLAAGQFERALPVMEETLKLTMAKLDADHPSTLASMNNLATAYQDAGRLDLALPLFEETLKLRTATLGPDHNDTLTSMNNLAVGYQAAGHLERALPVLDETLMLLKEKFGKDHPSTLTSMNNLSYAFRESGQVERAVTNATEYLKIQRPKFATNPAGWATQLARQSLEFLKYGEYRATEMWLRECLAIREKEEPDVWSTFNTQSMFGEALLGQRKYADAERLLLKGYEGMLAREKTIPPQGQLRIPEALDRLIWLYVATDRPAEAQKYRELRAKYPKEQAPKPRPPRPANMNK